MDIKLLKTCGSDAVKDIILHVLDRACVLLLVFAFGMLAYTLMYGTGALYILILCAMVLTGIVLARGFLHSAMVHVRYPLVLYLKKEMNVEETHAIHQLDLVSYVSEVALSTVFVLLLNLWCGLMMAVTVLLVGLVMYLLTGKTKDETVQKATGESVSAAGSFLLFAIVVLFIRHQEIPIDSAISILLAIGLLFPSVTLKNNLPAGLYDLCLTCRMGYGAVVVLELFQLVSVPSLYMNAVLAFLCVAPPCFVAAMHLWKRESGFPVSVMVLTVVVVLLLVQNMFAFVMGVFVIIARLFLLPALSATLYKGLEETEEDDNEEVYALLVQQCDVSGTISLMTVVILFMTGMTLLYLRGMIPYTSMFMDMVLMIGYMFQPSVCLCTDNMKEMVKNHLHQS